MVQPVKKQQVSNNNEIEQLSAAKGLQTKLNITSFLNNLPQQSQNPFFKACTHPLVIAKIKNFIAQLESLDSVVFYDPFNNVPAFASLHDLSGVALTNVYVQQIADIGKITLGHQVKPVDEIGKDHPKAVVVFAFDAGSLVGHIKHFLPADCAIFTLDSIKIEDSFLTQPANYLNTLNFATNFGFLRDAGGLHTRIIIANYWGNYGAKAAEIYLSLFDANGKNLCQWQQSLGGAGEQLIIDSKEIRKRFNLPEFTGNLFMHAIKITGHDIVKYICDVYDDAGKVHTVTHDSNSWPADYYAGIPAPQGDEKIILWIQNCHPVAIEPGFVSVRLMGHEETQHIKDKIPPYGTYAWDLSEALPAKWPAQYEVIANKYFTRPRFEVVNANGGRHISHANVERTDLVPDKELPDASKYLGKGYILPLSVLPINQYDTFIMPTPMSTTQKTLSIRVYLYNEEGELVVEKILPQIKRSDSVVINAASLLDDKNFTAGHIELAYDPDHISDADGWLHALIRYRRKTNGQAAETSFGAHIYNMPVVYKSEPQTYKGSPPGVRTTLVLRTSGGEDTFCHLIYPCSKQWLPLSSTDLILCNDKAQEVARKRINIAINGSKLWSYKEEFNEEQRSKAGPNAYIIIKDSTCRLFGFHGQVNSNGVFSFDHMFGF